ncbi:hypothetical protein HBI25_015780 [Parastagonospora nodorum]|nr:hypothetical protein HBH53_019410 [Parastagonospora nodorum]KAH3977572.1 hypothetical protein HBH52_113820 [Parastagonospora nodorum]KAH4000098.1 hypothetical protein HBI10_107940 [Parastagonospora nodorum]KAH4022333.1 hypothetical protein HBI13_101250 [Parastagonospora nodorum]KAH4027660.1 hypothetical protein HBI09_141570 [Parastagonospora nodorum]
MFRNEHIIASKMLCCDLLCCNLLCSTDGFELIVREMVRLGANIGSRAESLDRVRHLQLDIAFRSMQFSSGSASGLYLGEEVEARRCIATRSLDINST